MSNQVQALREAREETSEVEVAEFVCYLCREPTVLLSIHGCCEECEKGVVCDQCGDDPDWRQNYCLGNHSMHLAS